MPKDYKNIKQKIPKKGGVFQLVLPFLTGLTMGLFVAFIVYLNAHHTAKEQTEQHELLIENTSDNKTVATQEDEERVKIPEPQFDFYTILPKMEVNVSEWIADEGNTPEPVSDDNGVYILQVGSFRGYSSADEVKAKLALMGINANIQRVVINGRDVRHRVRIGPYKDVMKLHAVRDRLIENRLDFMLLKLDVDE